jgi:XRE family aerobic/anaerobic benzoate catabolism transcriptional regulator
MASDICVQVGERIRALRKARGWRQIDLAESAGISENYVSDLETGRKEVCVRTLQTIAKVLDKSLSDFFAGL